MRWPRLWLPPINLWTVPAMEDRMSETPPAYEAEDAVTAQLCARIDELQAEKEVLIEENDVLRKDNDNLRREVAGWRGA